MKINSNNILKLSYAILGIGIILVIISPFIFTRQLGFISFKETGQIGDTIGGITAPIVNLIGAILVFFALHAQIEANKIIQQQIDEQKSDAIKSKNFTNLLKLYDELKKDIEEFSFTRNEAVGSSREMFMGGIQPNFVTYKGNEAFDLAYSFLKRQYCEFINREGHKYEESSNHRVLVSLLKVVFELIVKVSKSILSSEDKDTVVALLRFLFESKLNPYSRDETVCKNCKVHHNELPDDLHDLIYKIQIEFQKFDKQNS